MSDEGIERSDSHAGHWFLLIFVVLTIGIIALGAFYYRGSARKLRLAVEDELSSIADLKVSELVLWRKERLADASILFKNPSFTAIVRRFVAQPADAGARRQILDWLGKLPEAYGYNQVQLIDARGVTRLSIPDALHPASSTTLQTVAEVLRSGRITFQDFYRNEYDHQIYLQVVIPLFDELDASRPLGVVNLRINAAHYLFPFIQKWPVPTQSGETLLIRREGDAALYLNDLRFRQNMALEMRVPLTNKNRPAAMAALGQTGIVEGVDYRNVPVVAALRKIPDSPWFLVARLDLAEVMESSRGQLWQVIAMIVVLLLGAWAAVGLVWRQQRVGFYLQRAETAEALRESEARFKLMVESVKDYAIIMLDVGGHVMNWNAGAEHIKGYQVAEIIGQHFSRFYPPEDVERGKPDRELVVAAAEGRFEDEGWRVRKDGSRFMASVIITALRDDAGQLQGFGKITRDITEHKQAEEEIRELNVGLEQRVRERTAELDAANKELEAFSYSVSHDLRAPLRSIDGFSRIVQEDYSAKLDDEGRDSLARIRAAAQRMAHLIDDLLTLSRIGRADLRRELVDLGAIADEVAAELRRQEPARAVELVIADGLTAQGDRRLLRVVLENLLGNAWKFTGKREHARIEIGAEQQDGRTAYFVRDNGAGFDAAHAAKLFGAFQRLHSSEEFAGTGIGLATVRRIVSRHGGRVWADGTVDQGATFWFCLNTEA